MISAWFASSTRAVSLSVSPFVRLEADAEMLTISALRRLAASSKEVGVRVLGSTKRLIRVLRCSAGTFFNSRVPTCLKASAVSRTRLISSAESSRRPNKSLRVQRSGSLFIFLRVPEPDAIWFIIDILKADSHLFGSRGREILPDEVRPDRQFAMAAI